MNLLVSAFGALLLGVGLYGVARPRGLVEGIQALGARRMMIVGVAVRLGMGVVLLLAAASCRHPGVVEFLGWLALVAAVLLPVMGTARLDALVRWWLERSEGFIRLQLCFVVLFGGYLIWVGLPA